MASRPIVTLTTDFGNRDHYVAAMKAAILRTCPDAVLVDVTHHIPPGDILAGSVTLEGAIASFDPHSVHLAVIDPGVGTPRRLIAGQINNRLFVCPDNGLITWTWLRHSPATAPETAIITPPGKPRELAPWAPTRGEILPASGTASEITWRPPNPSATFHGRDILAPIAAKLAAGDALSSFSRPIADPILLPIAPARQLADATIIYIDHFGNAVTNVGHELLTDAIVVSFSNHILGKILRTYADVDFGQPIALINSSGLLEIAVRNGSAAATLGLKIGDEVRFQ
jgi:S-adenosyl-L-methionine hydrolase (adenosine-forming)